MMTLHLLFHCVLFLSCKKNGNKKGLASLEQGVRYCLRDWSLEKRAECWLCCFCFALYTTAVALLSLLHCFTASLLHCCIIASLLHCTLLGSPRQVTFTVCWLPLQTATGPCCVVVYTASVVFLLAAVGL